MIVENSQCNVGVKGTLRNIHGFLAIQINARFDKCTISKFIYVILDLFVILYNPLKPSVGLLIRVVYSMRHKWYNI